MNSYFTIQSFSWLPSCFFLFLFLSRVNYSAREERVVVVINHIRGKLSSQKGINLFSCFFLGFWKSSASFLENLVQDFVEFILVLLCGLFRSSHITDPSSCRQRNLLIRWSDFESSI